MRINEAIKLYESQGGGFFDKDAMIFWGSAVVSELFENRCFVTIEDNYNRTQKLYSVRRFSKGYDDVETIGEFQAYKNFVDAVKAAKEVL